MVLDMYTSSQVQMTDGNKCVMLTDCKQINKLTFLLLNDIWVVLFIKLSSIHHHDISIGLSDAEVKMSHCPEATKNLLHCENATLVSPAWHLHGCGVVDLAHEEDAPCRMLQDEDQEGPVDFQGFRHTHGHDLDGGAGCCLCSCFIYAQHGLVGHL